MIKKQFKGETPIIWVVGDNHKQTEEFYYWFWHYGIAETDLEAKGFHGILTTWFHSIPQRKSFCVVLRLPVCFFLLITKANGSRVKGGAMSEARQWAINYWNKTETTTGYAVKRGKFNYHDYDNNHGRAENLSDIDA